MSDSLPPPSAPPPAPASGPEQSPPPQQSQLPPRKLPNIDSLPTSEDLFAARERRKQNPPSGPRLLPGIIMPSVGLHLPPTKVERPPGQASAAVDTTNSAASSSTSSPSAQSNHSHTHAHSSPPSRPSQPSQPADQPNTANMPPPARPVPVPARQKPATPPGPEKCLTWCSQRDGANAMCRMLCLRRRAPLPNQAEALARLRPGMRRDGDADGPAKLPRFFPSPAQLYAAHKQDDEAAAAKAAAAAEAASSWSGWSPFEALRNRIAPYSLIFVKGTPDGVVGRYMEELDGDDGQYDFGPISRHAPVTIRRKSTGNMEWLEWGDAGYILHVPLTSLFGPVINLPANAHRVLDPPMRLLSRYAASFTDGTQLRALDRLAEEVRRGGAVDMLGQIGKFYQRKAEKAKANAAEMAERERVQQEQAAQAAQAAQGGIRKEKDKGGE